MCREQDRDHPCGDCGESTNHYFRKLGEDSKSQCGLQISGHNRNAVQTQSKIMYASNMRIWGIEHPTLASRKGTQPFHQNTALELHCSLPDAKHPAPHRSHNQCEVFCGRTVQSWPDGESGSAADGRSSAGGSIPSWANRRIACRFWIVQFRSSVMEDQPLTTVWPDGASDNAQHRASLGRSTRPRPVRFQRAAFLLT